jgi:hypothetical protein
MYTGELINSLVQNVENAERNLLVKVTPVRKADDSQVFTTYMYDFGRADYLGVA